MVCAAVQFLRQKPASDVSTAKDGNSFQSPRQRANQHCRRRLITRRAKFSPASNGVMDEWTMDSSPTNKRVSASLDDNRDKPIPRKIGIGKFAAQIANRFAGISALDATAKDAITGQLCAPTNNRDDDRFADIIVYQNHRCRLSAHKAHCGCALFLSAY